MPILPAVETPDFFDVDPNDPSQPPPRGYPRPGDSGLWALGDRVTWVSGLVLALSSFMGWYSGSGVGIKLAVIGWHTGTLGKLVFFVGFAVLAIVTLRELGYELPPAVPESLVASLGVIAGGLLRAAEEL
jgi:hypothetical protein